jgi:metal-sulfur cluster biosynthetic enzyme
MTRTVPTRPTVEQVRRAINTIVDPCSHAAGTPIGLADMGLVKEIAVTCNGRVTVGITPTFAGCLFTGVFAHEIEERVGTLVGCTSVDVELIAPEEAWTEAEITPIERAKLRHRRDLLRLGAHAS